MDETVLFPSPNWFQMSGSAVSTDNWVFYGGPTKTLCVLEPLPSEYKCVVSGNRGYKAHVVRLQSEKLVSVDISPEWPEIRSILTASCDGLVKQWSIEREGKIINVKISHNHEIHNLEKEEIAGVGYSTGAFAISVGSLGKIVKWDLKSNVVKTYTNLLKGFKPMCMACSQHIPFNVAVGTKQGVIFVMDLSGLGKMVYKVRGQDEEIIHLSWCPQFEVGLKKSLDEIEKKANRLNKIKDVPEPKLTEKEVLEVSGVVKNLPDDSFDESIVQEDDMFDIYKDHEPDEFGHKKYEPEDIFVKVKSNEKENDDYLVDCMKLKEEILMRKKQPEPSIESLVEALDKTHVVEGQSGCSGQGGSTSQTAKVEAASEVAGVSSLHIHKHLLATVGKYGSVRVWSKSGKLVSTCNVSHINAKNQRNKTHNWSTLLWYKPDILLIADGKSQLLRCNPLKIDRRNKLRWQVVHTLHKRGLFCIMSNAPRVQRSESLTEGSKDSSADISPDWSVWTVSQDRNLIEYCVEKNVVLAERATCGGYVYMIKTCPYDAGKIAMSVGDGAVRVWNTGTLANDETTLSQGHVSSYWSNVQGKVHTISWHPTKENLLAFGTAESRVGLIDTYGKIEKPAKVLFPALGGGVYGLSWGENMDLFACGGGELVVYRADKVDEAPQSVTVELEGQKWFVCSVRYYSGPRVLVCGSGAGALAVLAAAPPRAGQPHCYNVVAAAFVFNKMIHYFDWHPQETTSSNKESPYKNLIAASSGDKKNGIVILEYHGEKDDGSKQLTIWKTLTGHKNTVFNLSWNPHKDGQLLSTSQDGTVRVWDIEQGVCTTIFPGHLSTTLGASWAAFPQLSSGVMTGGGDSCLRMWDIEQYPAEEYDVKTDIPSKKKKNSKKPSDTTKKDEPRIIEADDVLAAEAIENCKRGSKRFVLPTVYKQINNCNSIAARKMLEKYLQKASGEVKEDVSETEEHYDLDFLKVFGSINDVNEVLDMELTKHKIAHNDESYIMLCILRGHIDTMIQYAVQRDMLCPFLVSITPSVSFKYWKDVTRLYLAQVDRLVATGEEYKLYEKRHYGGSFYRKAAILLSMQDIKGAVATLVESRLYKEAYFLCRTRYIDSIAEDTLFKWARTSAAEGTYPMAASCYLALGNLSQAAIVLSKSKEQEDLILAADIAKVVGQTTFADHVEKKAQLTGNQEVEDADELLEDLPSKIELLLRDIKIKNGESSVSINDGTPVSTNDETPVLTNDDD